MPRRPADDEAFWRAHRRYPLTCDVCGHRETGRTAPGRFVDLVFEWTPRVKVCDWCARRVYGYGRLAAR